MRIRSEEIRDLVPTESHGALPFGSEASCSAVVLAEQQGPRPITEGEGEGDKRAYDLVTVQHVLQGTKLHLTMDYTIEGPRSCRGALCGWHFGKFGLSSLSVGDFAGLKPEVCRNCARSAVAMGLTTKPTTKSDPNEDSSNESDSVNGSDGNSSSVRDSDA